MSKNFLFSLVFGLVLSMGITGLTFAQQTITTTTTKTEVVQNADGTYTVIEYPVGKEVVVDLTPYNLQGAKGFAKVMRTADGTTIAVDLTGLPADTESYYVYAVDSTGAVTLLGPAMIKEGVSSATFTTEMNQFMLVLSPNEGLTTFATETPVVFRSAVPSGYAVVPVAVTSSGGAKQVATTTPVNSAYQVPMLNLPAGKTSEIRFNFTGELSGVKGKAYIEPKKDGSTQIKMRFDNMKNAASDTRFILWAASSDGKYTKVGQVINTGKREEGEIRGEIAMTEFGLLVTVESIDVEQPSGAVYTVFTLP